MARAFPYAGIYTKGVREPFIIEKEAGGGWWAAAINSTQRIGPFDSDTEAYRKGAWKQGWVR